MSRDSRGVERGQCTSGVCCCLSYSGGSTGLKCLKCQHPPGKHENLSTPVIHSSPAASTNGNSHPYSYAGAVNSGPTGTSNYGPSSRLQVNSPYHYPLCKADGCNNHAYYDKAVGFFDYCTPECRNRHLLPTERKRLEDDLKKFSDSIREVSGATFSHGAVSQQVKTTSGPLPRTTPPETQSLPGATPPEPQPQHRVTRSNSSGQKTFSTMFTKISKDDLGLILSQEKFCRGEISGLMVLGAEYDSTGFHLLSRGDVHLLDVLTRVNSKEISPVNYKVEMIGVGSRTLILNRSFALPDCKKFFEKVAEKDLTHVFAVMNPKDCPDCSVEKDFGLDVSSHGGLLYSKCVSAVTKKTPARFAGLLVNDEIVAHAFVDGGNIEIQYGLLERNNLTRAASEGMTLVLAIKRPIKFC